MRRAQSLLLGIATAALVNGVAIHAAHAQSAAGEARGLRYLSWNGRTAPAAGEASPVSAPPERADLRRPNRVIPHGGAAAVTPRPGLTPAPGGHRSALTPANAWLRPSPAPAATPVIDTPPPAPAPSRMAPPPAPAPAAAPPPPPPSAPLPEYIPDRGGQGQPIPTDVLRAPPPAPPAGPDVSVASSPDPMAPRRDALIFRMQQAPQPMPAASPEAQPASDPVEQPSADAETPQPRRVATVQANPADRPPAQGARYYSVHRQHGRTPDALDMPAPTYVDALTVTGLPETIASQDLAQPEPAPTMIRDAQGRVRVQPAAPEGDYQ